MVKLLFSDLYETTPTVPKRGKREVPVGTVIFDPDGEYFWPDDKNRPGLCDVPALQDKIVDAAIRGDRDLAFEALLEDPNSPEDEGACRRIFDELVSLQADKLPF